MYFTDQADSLAIEEYDRKEWHEHSKDFFRIDDGDAISTGRMRCDEAWSETERSSAFRCQPLKGGMFQ